MWNRRTIIALHSTLLLFFTTLALPAQTNHGSAQRGALESFEAAMTRSANQESVDTLHYTEESMTAIDRAFSLEELNSKLIPNWRTQEDLIRGFQSIRDTAVLTLPEDPDQPRRIAWNYIEDGCFARATIASEHLESLGLRRPAKVFIFGSLSASTPTGDVYWWYHVAPIVAHQGVAYVLDPALNASSPLPIEEWVYKMTDNPTEVSLSICNPFTYKPWDHCYLSGPSAEDYALIEALHYSRLEESSRVDF